MNEAHHEGGHMRSFTIDADATSNASIFPCTNKNVENYNEVIFILSLV